MSFTENIKLKQDLDKFSTQNQSSLNKVASYESITEQNEATHNIPYNITAEQSLIGAIIINNEILSDIMEVVKPIHFFDTKHQKIYESIIILFDKKINIHHITITQHLGKHEIFNDVDLAKYLQNLIILGSSVLDPMSYALIIQDLSIRRELMQLAIKINYNAIHQGLDFTASKQIEECENVLYNLITTGIGNKSFLNISEGLKESITSINKNRNAKTRTTGIPSQFTALDSVISGFHNSDLFILAARPGMGKTTLTLNFMYNAAIYLKNLNKSIGIFSLEMQAVQLSNKLIAMDSGVNSEKLMSGQMSEEEYNKIRISATRLSELPIYIDDTGALTISGIRARARRLKRKHNLGILFIDYLQLVQPSKSLQNRVLEISEITQSLKALAKELNIPIIALSQLSRAVEQRQDKRPLLSDLRESGSIEQDADIVMFIYRDEYYNRDNPEN
ncbi:MAG: replicative DNA helicase, partial [Rickettsiales bacterium]